MGEYWMVDLPDIHQRVMSALLRPVPSHRSELFPPIQKRIIEKMQKIMQTRNDIIILVATGTGGLEACGVNFFKPGDNVIVPVCGTFSSRLCEYVKNAGANAIKVEAPVGEEPSFSQVREAFKEAKNVKALFTVYDETSTGVNITWLKEAGELCKEQGSLFIMDAHAAFSVCDLPVDKWGIDVCVTGSQLSLGGPTGLCFMSISEKARKYLEANPPKSIYFSIPYYLNWYEVGLHPFSPAATLMLAMDEALNIVLEEGLDVRIKSCAACAEAYYSAFEAIGIEPLVKKKEIRSTFILSFKIPDAVNGDEFRRFLDNKYGIFVAGPIPAWPNSFRIVPGGPVPSFREGLVFTIVSCISSTFNLLGYKNDMGKAVEAAHKILKDMPVPGKKEYSPDLSGRQVDLQSQKS